MPQHTWTAYLDAHQTTFPELKELFELERVNWQHLIELCLLADDWSRGEYKGADVFIDIQRHKKLSQEGVKVLAEK